MNNFFIEDIHALLIFGWFGEPHNENIFHCCAVKNESFKFGIQPVKK